MRVLIADDHSVVRHGLKQLIAAAWPQTEFGEGANAAEVMAAAQKQPWDLILLDISMPGLSGLEVLQNLRHDYPGVPVLILTMYSEQQYALRVLKAGASGFLNKNCEPEELLKAIRRITEGGRYVSSSLAEHLAVEIGKKEKQPHELLSDREFQVLTAIASGKTVSEIAATMSLSVKTVSTYRARILEKTGMRTNAELTHYVIRQGLVA